MRSDTKPLLLRNEDCHVRIICQTCNVLPADRKCLQCNEVQCSSCFCKKHGPDTLVDDMEAAKLLGTAAFGYEIPLHRHGWIECSLETAICNFCKAQFATTLCKECEIVECSECYEQNHEQISHKHVAIDTFRTRYRGEEDLVHLGDGGG